MADDRACVLRDSSGAYYQGSEDGGIVLGKKRTARRLSRDDAERQASVLCRYNLAVEEVGLTISRDRPPAIVEASVHPARGVVADMLVRRGDDAGVADGRAIAIVEMLLRMKMLRRDPPTYRELLETSHAGQRAYCFQS